MRMWAWKNVFAVVLLVVLCLEGSVGTSQERRLLNNLMDDYNVLERPVANNNDSVMVKFGLSLLSINEVDEKGYTIDTTFWLTLKWNDVNLRWNPSEYDNITDVRIPIQRIWQPDIHVANSQRDITETTYYETMVVVKNDGNTIYAPPGNHKTSCTMNFGRYPLDEQSCEIRFGSWTYDSGKLNLELINERGEADISSYVGNNEWYLKGVSAQTTSVYFGHSCCDPYVKVIFTIHIQRKGEFILCCSRVLNALICFMMLMSFVLSPQSGQKLVIGIGLMICNIWILAYMHSVLPPNFHCQLRQYFERLCALVLSSIIANMFTIFLHYRIHPMSEFVRRVFVDRIPNILCTCCPRKSAYLVPMPATEIFETGYGSGPRKEKGMPPTAPRLPNPDFQDLLAEIHYLKRKLSVHEDTIKSVNDWNYLASVVDRLFAIIYGILIVVFVVVLFPSF